MNKALPMPLSYNTHPASDPSNGILPLEVYLIHEFIKEHSLLSQNSHFSKRENDSGHDGQGIGRNNHANDGNGHIHGSGDGSDNDHCGLAVPPNVQQAQFSTTGVYPFRGTQGIINAFENCHPPDARRDVNLPIGITASLDHITGDIEIHPAMSLKDVIKHNVHISVTPYALAIPLRTTHPNHGVMSTLPLSVQQPLPSLKSIFAQPLQVGPWPKCYSQSGTRRHFKGESTLGTGFFRDLNMCLTQVSGFCLTVAYTTEKGLTYNMSIKHCSVDAGNCDILNTPPPTHNAWFNNMVRLPLGTSQGAFQGIDAVLLYDSVMVIPTASYWGLKCLGLEGLNELIELQHGSSRSYAGQEEALVLTAAIWWVLNGLSSRPREGMAYDALSSFIFPHMVDLQHAHWWGHAEATLNPNFSVNYNYYWADQQG
ncbi:hypothetical protein BS47DRAFT_1362762 [Hydnum rufescens UP504]|uniref:Uncharacterized protein n=1 Tax=Hydnum rufescens UP504 TaxID=1448309 RepID=A0A9P6DS85_9AGAM|nr:hypothetical protein BS47DRAFT_1362762 [Hydnum rufescens UP504]